MLYFLSAKDNENSVVLSISNIKWDDLCLLRIEIIELS